MAVKVTTIPATRPQVSGSQRAFTATRRVAAYARVSTATEEQATSYEAQVAYYTDLIEGRPDWIMAGIYTDEGITGTNTLHREGFKTMVNDALAGRIDLIVTKSVSRFARNTVDSLTTVRKLKDHGVEIFFEKENIWTLDAKGELLITIMSSLAQEESRSISENVRWGVRKRFADGRVTLPYKAFLGYDKGPDGRPVINPEQARLVRRIYSMFLSGMSPNAIATTLTTEGQAMPGRPAYKWWPQTIKSILSNEKYKGDALLQKSYISDFLTKKQIKNHGEVPQYYVTGSHEPIIDPDTFELVQYELKHRPYRRGGYPFSSMITCTHCGSIYGSKIWHSTDAYRSMIWQCNNKYGQPHPMNMPHPTSSQLETAFMKALADYLKNRSQLIETLQGTISTVMDTSELEVKREALAEKIEKLSNQISDLIENNARKGQDQEEYDKRFTRLQNRFDKATSTYQTLSEEIADKQGRGRAMSHYLQTLQELEVMPGQFNERTWHILIDHATCTPSGEITFHFKDAATITIKL